MTLYTEHIGVIEEAGHVCVATIIRHNGSRVLVETTHDPAHWIDARRVVAE